MAFHTTSRPWHTHTQCGCVLCAELERPTLQMWSMRMRFFAICACVKTCVNQAALNSCAHQAPMWLTRMRVRCVGATPADVASSKPRGKQACHSHCQIESGLADHRWHDVGTKFFFHSSVTREVLGVVPGSEKKTTRSRECPA